MLRIKKYQKFRQLPNWSQHYLYTKTEFRSKYSFTVPKPDFKATRVHNVWYFIGQPDANLSKKFECDWKKNVLTQKVKSVVVFEGLWTIQLFVPVVLLIFWGDFICIDCYLLIQPFYFECREKESKRNLGEIKFGKVHGGCFKAYYFFLWKPYQYKKKRSRGGEY